VTYSGFVNGEDASDLGGTLACATTTPEAGAGTYTVTCSGLTSSNYGITYTPGTLTVTKEDATVAFSTANPAALIVSAPGGSLSANGLTLEVTVREKSPDLAAAPGTAAPGDISLAGLTVQLSPIAGGSAITLTCTSAVSAGTGYAVVKTFTCKNPTALPVATYEVIATVTGSYFTGSDVDGFTVFDPSLGFATGGGKFLMPNGNGTFDRVNFGFVMQYAKNGSNLKGNFVAVRHHADGTVSRLKSNALNSGSSGEMALTSAPGCGTVTFSGKANYTVWNGTEYVTTGGLPFKVAAFDRNQPGTGVDSIWIGGPGVFNMGTAPSGACSATGPAGAATLVGGNIAIPHTPAR